jgi:hypothetical protein
MAGLRLRPFLIHVLYSTVMCIFTPQIISYRIEKNIQEYVYYLQTVLILKNYVRVHCKVVNWSNFGVDQTNVQRTGPRKGVRTSRQ